VFSEDTFFPMASLTTTVPILSVGGIAKEFLVPGWRVGWVIVFDKGGVFEEVLHITTMLVEFSPHCHCP
jgi:tyrosine aminotransferase